MVFTRTFPSTAKIQSNVNMPYRLQESHGESVSVNIRRIRSTLQEGVDARHERTTKTGRDSFVTLAPSWEPRFDPPSSPPSQIHNPSSITGDRDREYKL